jgi:hypothetical protein
MEDAEQVMEQLPAQPDEQGTGSLEEVTLLHHCDPKLGPSIRVSSSWASITAAIVQRRIRQRKSTGLLV